MLQVRPRDLVEVLADETASVVTQRFWYGEVLEVHGDAVTVNYVVQGKDQDKWRYEKEAYETTRETINHVESTRNGRDLDGAWKRFGFRYMADDDITYLDGADSDEDDVDWTPECASEVEESDADDSESADATSSESEATTDEDDYSIANSDEHADEVSSDPESEDASCETPRATKRRTKQRGGDDRAAQATQNAQGSQGAKGATGAKEAETAQSTGKGTNAAAKATAKAAEKAAKKAVTATAKATAKAAAKAAGKAATATATAAANAAAAATQPHEAEDAWNATPAANAECAPNTAAQQATVPPTPTLKKKRGRPPKNQPSPA
jgi:hypothetical protein